MTGFHSCGWRIPHYQIFKRLFELIPIAQNTYNSVFTTVMGTVTSLFFLCVSGICIFKISFSRQKISVLFYHCHHAGTS